MPRSIIGHELMFDPYEAGLAEKVCTINKEETYGN